jgi:hypothetical protein
MESTNKIYIPSYIRSITSIMTSSDVNILHITNKNREIHTWHNDHRCVPESKQDQGPTLGYMDFDPPIGHVVAISRNTQPRGFGLLSVQRLYNKHCIVNIFEL